jgi:transposase
LSVGKYYLRANKTQKEVCDIFGCSPRSLMRWVERYNKEGSIKRHSKKLISYKITKDKVKFILNELRKNKTITLEDLHIKAKENIKKIIKEIPKENYKNILKGAYESHDFFILKKYLKL